MVYENFLIVKDERKGYITSDRFLIFDSFFRFLGCSDTEELAISAIEYKKEHGQITDPNKERRLDVPQLESWQKEVNKTIDCLLSGASCGGSDTHRSCIQALEEVSNEILSVAL